VFEKGLRAEFKQQKEAAVREVQNAQDREKQKAVNEAVSTVRSFKI
jgi:hypothetical protein